MQWSHSKDKPSRHNVNMSVPPSSHLLFVTLVVVWATLPPNSSGNSLPGFLGFFPCGPDSQMSSLSDVQNCDLFTYVAAEMAMEKVGNNLSLFPITTRFGNDSEAIDLLYDLYVQVNDLANRFHADELRAGIKAVVGPDNNYVAARQYAPITSNNIKIPMISYGISDDRFDMYLQFYRTIPSSKILDGARLKLLDKFKWYRIGILGSSQQSYVYQMESFSDSFNLYVKREFQANLSYKGLTNDIQASLMDIYSMDIRIIVGFFGPEEARMVLCEASSQRYGLTTSQHVWILPAFYNPNWWRMGGASYHGNTTCSDDDMIQILNSVIFIDTVKYPPLGTPLREFYSDLLMKTRDLYPDLDPGINLESFLQHSRATSAYDSAILLAESVTSEELDDYILERKLVCELCRLYSDCFIAQEHTNYCTSNRYKCPQPSTNQSTDDILQSDGSGDENERITHSLLVLAYGQVLITQFVNGTHCPMVLWWPANTSQPERVKRNYVPVSTLINQTCARRLGLDYETMFFDVSNCPRDFVWKGRSSPPTSNVVSSSGIEEWALVFVGVFVFFGEVLIISLIVFSMVWRNNIHVKSSSPRINLVILIGTLLLTPYSFIEGLVLSSNRYDVTGASLTLACQLNLWFPLIGQSMFVGGLIVKNWRLYRIFHNKQLSTKLSCLSDRLLIMMALVTVLPTVIVLIVWNAISVVEFRSTYKPNGDLQFVNVTYCFSRDDATDIVMETLLNMYLATLYLISIGLLCLFGLSHAPRMIRLDVRFTKIAFVFVILPWVAFLAAQTVLRMSLLHYNQAWWLSVMERICGIIIIIILFGYQPYSVARDHWFEMKRKNCPVSKEADRQEKYYTSLLEQITELRESLAEKESRIKQIKAEQKMMDDIIRETDDEEKKVKVHKETEV